MVFYVLGLALVMALVFLLALIAVGVLSLASKEGKESMNNPAGLAFEVYRYAVCFVMVVIFALSAFMAITGVIASFMGTAPDATSMTTNGLAVLLSAGIFLLHWRLKNPAQA